MYFSFISILIFGLLQLVDITIQQELTDAFQIFCKDNFRDKKCQDDKGVLQILMDKKLIPADAMGQDAKSPQSPSSPSPPPPAPAPANGGSPPPAPPPPPAPAANGNNGNNGELTDAFQIFCKDNFRDKKCQDDKGVLKALIEKKLVPTDAMQA